MQRLFDAIAWWIRLHLNKEVSRVPKQQVWTESEPWLWRYRVLKLKFIFALTRAYWRGVHTEVGPSSQTKRNALNSATDSGARSTYSGQSASGFLYITVARTPRSLANPESALHTPDP